MRPCSFDELNVFYLEPFQEKSIGNWARQLMQHIPSINKIPVADPKRSLKRSYIESGVKYIDWFKQNFYKQEMDMMIMSESLNYLPLYTMYREYFKALPTVMFVHCTELDFHPLIRSQSSMWGELGTMTVVDRVHFFSEASKRLTLSRGKEYLSDLQLEKIEKKSRVMPLPMYLKDLDDWSMPLPAQRTVPTIMFNHRLDPDKQYLTFFNALDAVFDKGIDFRVYICGQPSSSKRDPVVQKFLQKWGSKVLHYGLVTDRKVYADLLKQSEFVVNACEEVMGISACEAAYCGAWPIVFNAGALPDIFPFEASDRFNTVEDLIAVLSNRLQTGRPNRAYKAREAVQSFDWEVQTQKYKDSWYEVYEKKMKTDSHTGATERVVQALQAGPLSKEDVLMKVLGWGSFDYWPAYRYRLLNNGVSYNASKGEYSLDVDSPISIISMGDDNERSRLQGLQEKQV